MVATILGAFRIRDIRNKVLFTALMLGLYRLGTHIPAPGVNSSAVNAIQQNFGGNSILGLLNLFSGGGLGGSPCSRWGSCPTSRHRSSCSC